MIVNEIKATQTYPTLDAYINNLVKNRVERMSNETIEELEHVADRLAHIRRLYKAVLIDYPDLDLAIQRQVSELNRISDWIKKEVD